MTAEVVFGRFHSKCSDAVKLSLDRAIARTTSSFGVALSKEPIPNGIKFFVKVLEPGSWDLGIGIGVTTKSPDSGPVPQKWEDIECSDQYWFIGIYNSRDCAAHHKGQKRPLPWELDCSTKGSTFGCAVSQTGELHLYHNGTAVDVVWEGLPTDEPLWGFVVIHGGWKVEADYASPKAAGQHKVTPLPSQPQHNPPPDQREVTPAPTGHPQDYAGQTFHFVERPPDGLTCAVCQALAYDPVQANCCGKIYCARCIERWKGRSNSCPTCRSTEQSDPPFNVFRDRNAHQRITSLAVHCLNWRDGCDKKMELSEVENHLTSVNCFMFQQVDCEYKRFGCAVVLPRKEIEGHLKTSVQNHLRLTKSRVEEMEGRAVEQEARMEEERAKRQLMVERVDELTAMLTRLQAKVKQLETNQ